MKQLAVLVALLALSARAEVQVSSTAEPPKWSIGAGLGFFEGLTVISTSGPLGGSGYVTTPRSTSTLRRIAASLRIQRFAGVPARTTFVHEGK